MLERVRLGISGCKCHFKGEHKIIKRNVMVSIVYPCTKPWLSDIASCYTDKPNIPSALTSLSIVVLKIVLICDNVSVINRFQ